MTTTTTPRNERLARKVELAAAHLHAIDAALVRRAGENLAAFQNRELTGPEAEGVLSVTVETLIDLIGSLSRDAAKVCRTCGFSHPESDCPRWPNRSRVDDNFDGVNAEITR